MNHIDDDTLMKIALRLVEEVDRSVLQEHISACADCRARLERIRRDMELIGSLEPRIERPYIPLPRTRSMRIPTWLKVASLLIIGFASGYGVSQLSNVRMVNIVAHRVQLSPRQQTTPRFTPCESADLVTEYSPEASGDSI